MNKKIEAFVLAAIHRHTRRTSSPHGAFRKFVYDAELHLILAAFKIYLRFSVDPQDFRTLTQYRPNRALRNQWLVFCIGIILTPVTLAGALLGYVRGYERLFLPKGEAPQLFYIPRIIKWAMMLGAMLAWVYLVFALAVFIPVFWTGRQTNRLILIYLAVNIPVSALVFGLFRAWMHKIYKQLAEARKFGSARLADDSDLAAYKTTQGIYIGGGYWFNESGHLLTVAGTRGGKGTNLIIPNLLQAESFDGSWVVIDPKGENAAVTARFQGLAGRRVIILNPWGLLQDNVGAAHGYNPLDILADKSSIDLVDDVQMIAEMIVPIEHESGDKFWSDSARSIIAGLILYLIVEKDKPEHTLATLWQLCRLAGREWQELVADMRSCEDGQYGAIIRNAGNEIVKHSTSPETFGSILSHVLQATDFLKSPALQKAMQSDFDPYTLAGGNVTLYIIIPADKLQSHYRWLRLVVTSLLRAVIRKPQKRVGFMLDEFAALGYLPEIETALATYAGYHVTIWAILQSLIQLKKHYGENWESFTANTAVRHYFSINDNFSAEYISKAIGETSNIINNDRGEGNANKRALITPDELRRFSGGHIFTFIKNTHPTYFRKLPYYEMQELEGRYDGNPYL